MISETQKIFDKKISISATCVRVPIKNCHGVSVEVEFEKEFYEEEIKGVIKRTNGVKLVDLPSFEIANGKDEVFIGRIKKSLAFKNGISYFCVGDNTLKGASLNAVQIGETLIKYGKI
jgi:aspartate-semialdehyde dehydrogenase